MHELAISSAIIETVDRYARGRKVNTVHLRVGSLRQVVSSSLAFYLELSSRETICEGAEFDLVDVDALMRCVECETEWDPAPEALLSGEGALTLPSFRCPSCNAAGAEVLAGNELMIDSIVVTEPEPQQQPQPS